MMICLYQASLGCRIEKLTPINRRVKRKCIERILRYIRVWENAGARASLKPHSNALPSVFLDSQTSGHWGAAYPQLLLSVYLFHSSLSANLCFLLWSGHTMSSLALWGLLFIIPMELIAGSWTNVVHQCSPLFQWADNGCGVMLLLSHLAHSAWATWELPLRRD